MFFRRRTRRKPCNFELFSLTALPPCVAVEANSLGNQSAMRPLREGRRARAPIRSARRDANIGARQSGLAVGSRCHHGVFAIATYPNSCRIEPGPAWPLKSILTAHRASFPLLRDKRADLFGRFDIALAFLCVGTRKIAQRQPHLLGIKKSGFFYSGRTVRPSRIVLTANSFCPALLHLSCYSLQRLLKR